VILCICLTTEAQIRSKNILSIDDIKYDTIYRLEYINHDTTCVKFKIKDFCYINILKYKNLINSSVPFFLYNNKGENLKFSRDSLECLPYSIEGIKKLIPGEYYLELISRKVGQSIMQLSFIHKYIAATTPLYIDQNDWSINYIGAYKIKRHNNIKITYGLTYADFKALGIKNKFIFCFKYPETLDVCILNSKGVKVASFRPQNLFCNKNRGYHITLPKGDYSMIIRVRNIDEKEIVISTLADITGVATIE